MSPFASHILLWTLILGIGVPLTLLLRKLETTAHRHCVRACCCPDLPEDRYAGVGKVSLR